MIQIVIIFLEIISKAQLPHRKSAVAISNSCSVQLNSPKVPYNYDLGILSFSVLLGLQLATTTTFRYSAL